MQKGLSIRLLVLAIAAASAAAFQLPVKAEVQKQEVGSMEVDMVGVVQTGIMAIGGETTGTTISTLGFTWELDLGNNRDWQALAEKFNGKELSVRGTVTVKQGVERGRRVIVVVKQMTALTK
jgi:hypothetical protein